MSDTAVCPGCDATLTSVEVRQLRTAHANTAVKFWTCPACETILGSTD